MSIQEMKTYKYDELLETPGLLPKGTKGYVAPLGDTVAAVFTHEGKTVLSTAINLLTQTAIVTIDDEFLGERKAAGLSPKFNTLIAA